MPRDTSFGYAFLVLPPAERQAITAVWDFCRAVDDAVDEQADAARAAADLARWRAELAACFDGGPIVSPEAARLRPIVERFGLSRQPFEDLIDGVEMDVGGRRYETFEDLRRYCLRVASAVGLICIEIFGCRSAAARAYAVELGVALQLTNILRDVAGDLARGRLYLPLEDLARFGVCEADLAGEAARRARGIAHPGVRALLAYEAERARGYFERARAARPRAERRRLVAAEAMRAIYAELLRRIERADYDVFTRRIGVPRPVRAVIAARTALAAWFGSLGSGRA
jgi:phytoene synthase